MCTWKISDVFNWIIWTHDRCDAGARLSPAELWSHTDLSWSICWAHVFPWREWWMREMFVRCGFRDEWKKWLLRLLANLSNCLICALNNFRWLWRNSNPWPLAVDSIALSECDSPISFFYLLKGVTLAAGLIIALLSFGLVFFINKRADKLFTPSVTNREDGDSW